MRASRSGRHSPSALIETAECAVRAARKSAPRLNLSDVNPILLERILRRLPLVGYAMRLLEAENYKELGLFGTNMLMAVILAVGLFGFPVFITIMHAAVLLAASFIFLATRS